MIPKLFPRIYPDIIHAFVGFKSGDRGGQATGSLRFVYTECEENFCTNSGGSSGTLSTDMILAREQYNRACNIHSQTILYSIPVCST